MTFAHKLTPEIQEAAARQRSLIDWDAPFQPDDDLRITTPVHKANVPRRERRYLAEMPQERREQLEREWLEAEAAVPPVGNQISDEIKRRAEREWEKR